MTGNVVVAGDFDADPDARGLTTPGKAGADVPVLDG
jgi:hypothetical protein